jgi:molybdate transport system regulatory protein
MRGALRDMEKAIGRPLVRIFRGGGDGGGAELTKAAYELMDSFKRCTDNLQNDTDARFEQFMR